MTRRAAKADANQPAIVAALRRCGFHVAHTHQVGGGFPDLVVTGERLPEGDLVALLVELKNRDGRNRLEPDERAFHAAYPAGGPLIIAYSERDVLEWFGRGEAAPDGNERNGRIAAPRPDMAATQSAP